MELTPEQREKIYLEEKARRESDGSSLPLLFLLTVGAVIGFAAILAISESDEENKVSLEALRKAYAGLAPEEEK